MSLSSLDYGATCFVVMCFFCLVLPRLLGQIGCLFLCDILKGLWSLVRIIPTNYHKCCALTLLMFREKLYHTHAVHDVSKRPYYRTLPVVRNKSLFPDLNLRLAAVRFKSNKINISIHSPPSLTERTFPKH